MKGHIGPMARKAGLSSLPSPSPSAYRVLPPCRGLSPLSAPQECAESALPQDESRWPPRRAQSPDGAACGCHRLPRACGTCSVGRENSYSFNRGFGTGLCHERGAAWKKKLPAGNLERKPNWVDKGWYPSSQLEGAGAQLFGWCPPSAALFFVALRCRGLFSAFKSFSWVLFPLCLPLKSQSAVFSFFFQRHSSPPPSNPSLLHQWVTLQIINCVFIVWIVSLSASLRTPDSISWDLWQMVLQFVMLIWIFAFFLPWIISQPWQGRAGLGTLPRARSISAVTI